MDASEYRGLGSLGEWLHPQGDFQMRQDHTMNSAVTIITISWHLAALTAASSTPPTDINVSTGNGLLVLVGFAGVIVGAVLKGVVDLALARVHERREGRVASLVLFSSLWDAHVAISGSGLFSVIPTAPGDDWGRFAATWNEHRIAFTRVATDEDFVVVAQAHIGILECASIQRRVLAENNGRPSALARIEKRDAEWLVRYASQFCPAGVALWRTAHANKPVREPKMPYDFAPPQPEDCSETDSDSSQDSESKAGPD